MPDAQVEIGQVVLTATQTSVVFSNIPQGYGDLVLVIAAVSSAAAESYSYAYFNSDTGSSYTRAELYGTGSAAASATAANLIPITMPSSTSATVSLNQVVVSDYTSTVKHKTVLYRNDTANATTLTGVGRWASLSAVNSISLTAYNNSFGVGSTFTLFGVSS